LDISLEDDGTLNAEGGRYLAAKMELGAAVIPLPYAHYRLVHEDGRAVERPDKHPFALSRVLYDPR
jgi:hypothetical protein